MSIKIRQINDPKIYLSLKRVCKYLVSETWKTHVVADEETEAKYNLAIVRSKKYKNDIILLSELDTDLRWGEKRIQLSDGSIGWKKIYNYNPWYRGELVLNDLLSSLEDVIDFITDDTVFGTEFLQHLNILKSYCEKEELNQNKSITQLIKKQQAEQAFRPTAFKSKSVLSVKPSAEQIFKSFSPRNYPFILMIIRGILSLTDFSPDGKVHYQLQSPPGQQLINERSLLNKLTVEGLFSYFGEDGIFGIATIGNINVEILRKIESYLTEALQQPKPQIESYTPDTASRRGLEKKWDVLQAIWTVYESHSRSDAVLVPVAAVTVKGRTPEEIDGIIDGIKTAGVFTKWERRNKYYTIENINHAALPKFYEQTRSAYVDVAKEYQKQNPSDTKQVTPLPVGVEYNSITHKIQFAEKEIPIPSDTDQDSLCKTIFKNKQTKTKEWNWDEMLQSWGGNYEDKNQWRKVYNAGREVNTKIAIETTIKDLLIVKKHTIAVNPKYLG